MNCMKVQNLGKPFNGDPEDRNWNFKDFVMERQDFGAYVGSGPREKSNSSADPDLLNRSNFSYCALLKIYSYL